MTEAWFLPVAERYRPETCVSHNRLKGNGHRRGYQPQGRRVREPRKRFPNAGCRLRRLCCPSVHVGAKLRAWCDAEAPSVSGNDHSLVPCGVGIAGRLQQVAPLPGVRERHSRDIGACEEQLFIAPVAFATTTRRASMGVPRSFPFVPGVYQRQSIVVDLGTVVPRGRYLKSIFLICRRCAPPVTPARLTSFALQRTHGCETVRLRGNEGSRRAQHRTFMFAGPWDARE